MADMKIPAGSQLPVGRPAAPARTEQVRAAQRAFFEAALNAAPAPAPARPAQPTVRAAEQTAASAAEAPSRYPRPGSRVDIKV